MSEPTQNGRILTLVFTDLADSTALKTEHGDAAVDALLSRHRAQVTQIADECLGRVIDWAGDGCFLTFETSSAAVVFALRLQQAHAADQELPGVRIGIHLGEVTDSRGPDGAPQVKGLAVDLAARIGSLAKPGQVLMSDVVYDSARQRLGVDAFGEPILWQAHGSYQLKGFDKAVEINEAGLDGIGPLQKPSGSDKAQPITRPKRRASKQVLVMEPPEERRGRMVLLGAAVVITIAMVFVAGLFLQSKDLPRGGTALIQLDTSPVITSLAVLPLDNLMQDPDQDYFADGMTEAITAELAKIKSLKVISRTSVMQYKGTEKTMPEIASELGVDGLIEGSVLREEDQVRITVQLIHGPSDRHLWSASYQNTLTSVLQLQADVAMAIADEVNVALSPEDTERMKQMYAPDPEAYEKYLLARFLRERATAEDRREAVTLLREATEIDPGFAKAWAVLARALISLSSGSVEAGSDIKDEARSAATRALELNPDLEDVRFALGDIARLFDWDWAEAERQFQAAIELMPNSGTAQTVYASLLAQLGRNDEIMGYVDRALDVDPDGFSVAHSAAGLARIAGSWERAEELAQALIQEDPDHPIHLLRVTNLRYEQGRWDDAVATARRWVDVDPDSTWAYLQLAKVMAAAGDTEESIRMTDELSQHFPDSFISPGDLIYTYVEQGRIEPAIAAMRDAYEGRDWHVLWMHVQPFQGAQLDDPDWVAFRQDDRYWEMLEGLNFPPLPAYHHAYAEEQAWHARKAAETAADAPIKKIAVLPFENLSSDPEQEYFVDGMTEALTAELVKIKSIKVVSRTSASLFKGSDKSAQEIARELNADALIEGSVLKLGNDVRITAQLIRGATDDHLWAESFDSTLENVLKLHSEVALAIATQVRAVVTPEEAEQLASTDVISPEAHDLYMRGSFLARKATRQGLDEGIELLRQATNLAPNYAPASAGLSYELGNRAVWGYGSAQGDLEEGLVAARAAVELDPSSSQAHQSLGWILWAKNWDWSAYKTQVLLAIELDPESPGARLDYGWYLSFVGQPENAMDQMLEALRLDPLFLTAHHGAGMAFNNARRHDEAIELLLRAKQLDPTFFPALMELGNAYVYSAQPQLAADIFEEAVRASDREASTLAGLAIARAQLGDTETANKILDEILVRRENNLASTRPLAYLYGYLGRTDDAFATLERAFEVREWGVTDLLVSPSWDPIRNDSRFDAYVQRLDIPEN